MTNGYKTPRTPATGKLASTTREVLELRWSAAVADPAAWRYELIRAASIATRRGRDEVERAWGLTP